MDSVAASAPAPAAAPQPFPAEPKRDADEFGAASVGGTRKPAMAPSAAPTSEFQRRKESAADAPSSARSPPAAAALAQERMAVASDDKRQRNEVAQSAPAAAGAMLAKKAASAETDSAMSDSVTRDAAKPVDVDAWIVRIRKLHDDGKLADAARNSSRCARRFPTRTAASRRNFAHGPRRSSRESAVSNSRNDVPPVALPPRPTPPRPEDCCGSGCTQCIYAIYDEAMLAWQREVERLLADAKKPV